MTPRRSRLIADVERKFNEPLQTLLPRYINDFGLTQTAQLLGVSPSTINYWALKYNIRFERVAVPPGHQVYIVRKS